MPRSPEIPCLQGLQSMRRLLVRLCEQDAGAVDDLVLT